MNSAKDFNKYSRSLKGIIGQLANFDVKTKQNNF